MSFLEGTAEEWNRALLTGAHDPFTQSWEWGTFQEATGRSVVRLTNGNVQAQIITMPLPRGMGYFYIPRGPLFHDDAKMAQWQDFRKELQQRADGRLFVRVDPVHMIEPGFPVSATQPQDTVVVDVTQNEEELLAAMHQKTRYNIRLAQKKGVVVADETNDKGLAAFLDLTERTATRHEIQSEPLEYFKKMFVVLAESGTPIPEKCSLKIFVARYEGTPVAISLALFFGTTMTYAHGASSDEHKNVMAPFLLHWEGLQYAKAHGYRRYDFRGVAPADAGAVHPWAGITRFKEGFGGARVAWPRSSDFPYRYLLYPAYRIGALLKHHRVW
ncbi:MAG: peptidoglycan bridge formation glycyltransferase FemA/FemB family protein [Patescibacteria group bacterium]|jgi:lipid II:glycine glycyltransferase (peptidoglycan interpeptide bridge formation enzyme)